MKKLVICAIVAGVGGPACAQSGFSFDINGQRVHIGVPKHCDDERCISITTGKPGDNRKAPADEQHIDGSQLLDMFGGLMGKRGDEDDPAPAPRRSAARPPAKAPAAPPVPGAPAPAVTPPPAGPIAALPPSEPPAAPSPVPAAPSPAPGVTATPPAVPAPGPIAALPPPEPDSPAGMWLTENSEGRIHIVPCGTNFCGYAVDAKSARDGEKILIDMKLVKDRSWKGRVRDPRGGGIYDATMSLKNSDTLGIRGCAMGGFICQGQTWTRG